MAINRRSLLIFIAAFFLAAPLWAQSTGYYVELRFIQCLSWTSDEYAMRYEVIIEKQEAGRNVKVFQAITEATFIEVSLSPGKYRYQVIPHDFFDQPIPVTEWVEFEVRSGDDQLVIGEHELVIVNSGDETSRKEITITVPEASAAPAAAAPAAAAPAAAAPAAADQAPYIQKLDIYLGAAWMPFLPLYGKDQLFGGNRSLTGFSARLSAVSSKSNLLNPGIELIAAWRMYEGGEEQASAEFDFNILAQSRFPGGKTALNLRAGAGLSLLPQTQPASPDGQYSVHLNIGASFLWLFIKSIYIETGVEYSQFFTEDYFGFIRPWIALGCRF